MDLYADDGTPLPPQLGPDTDQTGRPRYMGGTVSLGDQTFHWGSGGMGRGSIPYGNYPINIGKGDIGPVGQRIGSVATVGGDSGTINDPLYPGAPRQGIQIHPNSSNTLDELYTQGCFSVPPNEWPAFRQALLAQSHNGPLTLTIGHDGQARIAGAQQPQSARAMAYTDQAPATTVDDWKANPARGYQRPTQSQAPVVPQEAPAPQQKAADPWADYPDVPPSTPRVPAPPISGASADQWAAYPDAPPKPSREVGTAEAMGRGFQNNVMFGAEPALAGANEAANEEIRRAGASPEEADSAIKKFDFLPGGTAAKTLYGALKVLHDKFGGQTTLSDLITGKQPSPAVQAYDAKRAEEAQANDEAYDQNKLAYGTGAVGGVLAAPVPVVGRIAKAGAPLLERIGEGVANGMIGGGLFGAGHAIGEGKSVPDVAADTAWGVGTGALLGGAFNGMLGRRPAGAPTAADRAAQTAEQLGAPLPRGVVSNSPMIRATTAKMKEVPFGGEKIGEGVERTQAAAAKSVEDLATNLAGGAPTRTTAAPSAQPAIKKAIESNNKAIDSEYTALRGEINPDQHFPMPNLQKAIKEIKLRRARRGWNDPGVGLEQIENVANGIGHAGGFEGVHGLRVELRAAGKPGVANPNGTSVDPGEMRYLTAALNRDLDAGVRHVSTNPNIAESLYKTAELKAGDRIKVNKQLEPLTQQSGENIIGTLVNSAREKSGNIALLREAKRTMPPAAFDQVAGVLLHELGLAEGQTGEFSLSRFATNWAKVSEQAKSTMFSPQHREWIDNIAGLGNHLKDAGKFTNSSHTGSIILLLDIAKDAALLAHDLTQNGELGVGAALGAGTSLAAPLVARWLASPKTAAPMSRFVTAYRALTLNQPTPARVAAFKVATRQFANNVHVPFDRIMQIASDRLGSAPAQTNVQNEENEGSVESPRQ
jgi:hypothetical protein